jgi:outer membrane protein TolC
MKHWLEHAIRSVQTYEHCHLDLDLFGRIASSVNAATADVQQQEALYQSALLALQADVAQQFSLCARNI